MEALVEKKHKLEDELEKLDEQRKAIYEQLEKIKDESTKLEFDHLPDDYKEFLVGRMMLLKSYIDMHDKGITIAYRIEHIEQPKDDYHEPCRDYVSWAIYEGNLLDMMRYVNVKLKIHSELVKRFVEGWLNENIPQMCRYSVWMGD